MKAWLLLTIAVTGIACTTTTPVASLSDGAARHWLEDKTSSEMTVETKDHPSGLDDVRIEAISPTDIRFHATSGEVVPTDRVRRVTVRNHWRGGMEGMLLGAGAGVAVGVIADRQLQTPGGVNYIAPFVLGVVVVG